MIDLHILTHESTRPKWLAQAVASVEGQPATVHVVDNSGLSVGAGRARGYLLGSHEFVGYLDSDDYLLPGALDACLDGLRVHQAVVTMELVEYECGRRFPFARAGHALTVYRRADVSPWLAALAVAHHTADEVLRKALCPTQLPVEGYVWRVHADGDHHRINSQIIAEEDAACRSLMEQR